MTTPTNGSHDPIEDRLAAAFDRATKRAQVDLKDGRLAVEADRGRQHHRRPPVLRSGLVLAVVAVAGVGAIWAVGSQPRPAPTTPQRAATSSGGPSESPRPTDANGSPIPARAPQSPAPILQAGQIFPSATEGAPIYSVGGPAEAHVAEVTDAAPFYISGWVNGWELQGRPTGGCFDSLPVPLGTFDPATDYYDKCWGPDLSTTAGGPPSLHVLDEVSRGGRLYAVSTREPASAIRLVLKVHVHDMGCTIPECAIDPVLDEVVLTSIPVVNPVILAAPAPPSGPSLEAVVAKARGAVAQDFKANGAGQPVLLSVSLGTAAALHDPFLHGSAATWEWRVLFASDTGTRLEAAWVDAASGELTLEVGDFGAYWSTMP